MIIDTIWYKKHPLRWVLYPVSLIFQCMVMLRRAYTRMFRQYHCPVPVIVVGNLTVGGTGKTPLVIAIAQQLLARGINVGIVSRGYGAKSRDFPCVVKPDADARIVGDEPLLIAQKTGCPVVIDPNRVRGVQHLLSEFQTQVIISDDGLQHYRLGRAVEIIVVDGLRGLGNGLCLPAGPLRESPRRLRSADFVVVNANSKQTLSVDPGEYTMRLMPGMLTSLTSDDVMPLSAIQSPVAAVAAIGHPARFFNTLTALHIPFNPYPFPDHHDVQPHELNVAEKIIVMTEKDAVKCRPCAMDNIYVLPVEASMSDVFWETLWSHQRLKRYKGI